MTAVTINDSQRLFVIPSDGGGFTCLGFDVVFNYIAELVKRIAKAGKPLPVSAPAKAEIGTVKQYDDFKTLMSVYYTINDDATWFEENTPAKVRSTLEQYRKTQRGIRVFLGDPKTGKDWLDTYNTIGTIGRSMGPVKSVLMVPFNEAGGGVLRTGHIVRMVDLESGEELYRHKSYHLPVLDLVAIASDEGYTDSSGSFVNLCDLGYTHSVKVADAQGKMTSMASFKSCVEAAHWLAFVAGQSHDYPND